MQLEMDYSQARSYFMNSIKPMPLNIRSLTSLRFFAAMWVVLFHYVRKMGYDINQHTEFFINGYLAVDFFFVLSGFIMAHVYLDNIADSKFSVFEFLKKRFSRLYPIHIFTLFMYIILFGIFVLLDWQIDNPEAFNFSTLPVNLLMVHAWGTTSIMSFNHPSWSISAEWFAYLAFFPIALIIIRTRKYPGILLIASACLFLAVYYFLPYTGLVDRKLTRLSADFGIIRIIPEFILGISTYVFCAKTNFGVTASRIGLYAGIIAFFILAQYDINDLVFVALFTLIIFSSAALSRHEDAVGWLGNPALVYLGDISYSIYMVHAIFYTVYFNSLDLLLGKHHPPILMLLFWGVALVGIVMVASITYRFIEVPGRAFLNGWLLKKANRSKLVVEVKLRS